ncbi:hypothetical protein TRAPUB_12152 [Trametes pubescens]|uniref:Uncharacterized protein n=1 Tax=Trametes pubescens TaxID=154538 RepID=A0A1M2VUY4_TRAPU|nr:hypothetical protein TRAPUB_12152 [Trametes pubescens]
MNEHPERSQRPASHHKHAFLQKLRPASYIRSKPDSSFSRHLFWRNGLSMDSER